MIEVTRFNGVKFYLNPEIIQYVETTPDTVITLTTKEKLLVKESAQVIVEEFIHYQRLVHNPEIPINSGAN
ncbi:MAG: flagellar FlbD family protein [Anaerolineales bacterium]|jgi:flagellar protein FlbD